LLVDGFAVRSAIGATDPQHTDAPRGAGRVERHHKRNRGERRDRGAGAGSRGPNAHLDVAGLIAPDQHTLRAGCPGGRVASGSTCRCGVSGKIRFAHRVKQFHVGSLCQEFQFVECTEVLPHDFINDILQRGVGLVHYVVAHLLNVGQRVLKKLDHVAGLLGAHQADGADQTVPALVGFGKLIGQLDDVVVELVERGMFGKRSGVQVNRVGDISGQKQGAYEITAFHCICPSIGIGGISRASLGDTNSLLSIAAATTPIAMSWICCSVMPA